MCTLWDCKRVIQFYTIFNGKINCLEDRVNHDDVFVKKKKINNTELNINENLLSRLGLVSSLTYKLEFL